MGILIFILFYLFVVTLLAVFLSEVSNKLTKKLKYLIISLRNEQSK